MLDRFNSHREGKMTNRARIVFLLIIICIFCPKSFADGHFYNTEPIPSKIPYQRAFLIFHESAETLILQSKYEFLGDTSNGRIGWVVPVPSTPEILSLDPDKANGFFWMVSLNTQPHIIRISEILFLIFLLLSVVFSVIYLIYFVILMLLFPFLGSTPEKWKSLMKSGLTYLPLFFAALLYLFIALPCLNRAKSQADVEVMKSEQVGIYDVQVIKSDSENAIVEWLNENGFVYITTDKLLESGAGELKGVSAELYDIKNLHQADLYADDVTVFKDYIVKQWCFVVAKIRPDAELNKVESRGMVAPLVLKFKTEKAIYPLALTSLVGQDTEVLLYTLTENKQTCGNLIPLKRSKLIETSFQLESFFQRSDMERQIIIGDLPEKMSLCKFKKILKPEQMKTDLIFESAEDNEPYIERKIMW